ATTRAGGAPCRLPRLSPGSALSMTGSERRRSLLRSPRLSTVRGMGLDLLEGLSEAQAEVVTTTAAPLAVVAGPGAGKTRVLTRRIAWRARHGDADADHVLVLTFSRRAAGELLGRLSALGLPAGARVGGERPAGLTAGTFHAVAWAQLARHRADRG